MSEKYYGIEGWEGNCNISTTEIDKKIKQINRMFDSGDTISTEILYQTADFQLNVNYYNMVFAICVPDILVIDSDFNVWSRHSADKVVKEIGRFCDFMHAKGIDLLFKMFRTDKGLHAFLVNKRIKSNTDTAIKIMVALCNDPFYTAFSKISGFCVRINPKIYRVSHTKASLYSRVTSEIIAKEYNQPKYIGYGKPDPGIESFIMVKTRLINFMKKKYKEEFGYMTKLRYISRIDDFKKSPPPSFFEELIEYTKKIYITNINPGYTKEEIYHINYEHNEDNYSSLSKMYTQENLSLYFDIYKYVWMLCIKKLLIVTYSDVNLEKFNHINEYLTKYSFNEVKSFTIIPDNTVLIVIYVPTDNTDYLNVLNFLGTLDTEISSNNKLFLRVSPMI